MDANVLAGGEKKVELVQWDPSYLYHGFFFIAHADFVSLFGDKRSWKSLRPSQLGCQALLSDSAATEGELSPRPSRRDLFFYYYFRSVAVDHFTSSYSPSIHASLRAGCARGGSIGQHLLREAGGPTPRTGSAVSKRQNCSSLKIKLTDRYD